ncbi:MAG TPA: MmcQ/YjbR family DNA-binding protein [Pedococcus sp.]|uniref:MmcQ/YjbR family DNA-binding protein n=1 Tax=Pedococcus sp. TaxID=2860345 RepID=UPI002F9268A9
MAARMARVRDVTDIACSLPEVDVAGTDERPSFAVRGKTFVFFRGPRKDAVDPDTGEPMEDVICFSVGDLADKEALVEGDGPFFTTPHFNGYRAVLLRERDLRQVTRQELAEVITDAWAARAPKRLARQFLEDSGPPARSGHPPGSG